MFRINIAASQGAGAVNEDVVGHVSDAAWVIDGASGVGGALTGAPSDAAWFAQQASRELAAALATQGGCSTGTILRHVMERCRAAFQGVALRSPEGAHELPSAAFAMVRLVEGRVEFTTLGDCRIIHAGEDGRARVFGETALAAIEARTLDAARRILAAEPDISPAGLRDRLMPQLRVNRRLMNRPDGYWVLGLDPDAADHVDTASVPIGAGGRFGIASDGFLRLTEIFDIATPEDLLAVDSEAAFARRMAELRAVEAALGSLGDYPRVKVHDDASFVHLNITGEQ